MNAVRAELRAAPSKERFTTILSIISEAPAYTNLPPWRDEQEREEAVTESERALEGWDESYRAADATSQNVLKGDTVQPAARLLRHLTFYRISAGSVSGWARAFAASPHMRGLRAIEIVKCDGDVMSGFAGPSEIRDLASLNLRDAYLADATWKALSEHFDEKQRMDVVFTAGQYTQVSMFLNTFGVQLEPGATLDPELRA